MNKFYITIGSLPHREALVAAIFYDDFQFAEISEDTGETLIEFYPNLNKRYWEFKLDELMEVLEEAKKRLTDFKR